MPNMERGVVKAPNQTQFAGTSGDPGNGFLPLTRTPSPTVPTNMSRFMHGDPGGSANLTRMGSPVSPPNAGIFSSGDKGMSDANYPAAVQPGNGAVAVNPFKSDGSIVPAADLRDSAKK